jgi:hypothetical protein
MGSLYRALDAGLKAETNPEQAAKNELLGIAASPGLDIYGGDVYAVAVHYATLAGLLATALRNAFREPWRHVPDLDIGNPALGPDRWRSGLYYDAGNGILRRLVLVDRWSDDRKASEQRGWRTVAETAMLGRAISVTAIEIGSSHKKHRISPWTRCYRHPRNDTYRFRRRNSDEDFSQAWKAQWREDSGITTADWLAQMQKDGCLDAVQTMTVPPPARRGDFTERLYQIAEEVKLWEDCPAQTPPMRLAGCQDVIHGPCPFISVCHGIREPSPERYGFRRREPLVSLEASPRAHISSASTAARIAVPPTGSG